ncbi:MAG: AmmeMemoRadiSam system protein A [Deltaproteobacteria bacterium]|nr:AmmeMemoRadiSam system protein A [Deltaproteobacteria bacterium]
MTEPFDDANGKRLLAIAREAVRAAAAGERLRVAVADEPAELRLPGAAFVTLRSADGSLRGCIGSLSPVRPLAEDVAANAASAALRDPRFTPVTPTEVPTLAVSIAVLSPFEPIEAADEGALLAQLRPGVDGLVIRDRGRRAVFLPQVWGQLPEPRAFLDALKQKAGLGLEPLSQALEAERFTVSSIGK